MLINDLIELANLLDAAGHNKIADIVDTITKNAAAVPPIPNLLKWKFYNRELKQKFKNLREVIAIAVESLGQTGAIAVAKIGNWIKYVDELQADPIDESPYKTEYDDQDIEEGTTWWSTFKSVIDPLEAENPNWWRNGMYQKLKSDIGNIFNKMNQITGQARIELSNLIKVIRAFSDIKYKKADLNKEIEELRSLSDPTQLKQPLDAEYELYYDGVNEEPNIETFNDLSLARIRMEEIMQGRDNLYIQLDRVRPIFKSIEIWARNSNGSWKRSRVIEDNTSSEVQSICAEQGHLIGADNSCERCGDEF